MSDIFQIIYHSQPFGYDEPTLAGILLDARRCNKRDGITGALVCRHDIFLQLLEGPKAQIDAAFARIEQDDRHVETTLLVSGLVSERMFGAWEMLHDPAKSWIWTEDELADGALARATPDEITGVFRSLAEKVNAPQ
jgi:hypothetical protein